MIPIDDSAHGDIYLKTREKCEGLSSSCENISYSYVANTTHAASLCQQLEDNKERKYGQKCGELWSYGQNSYGELGTGDMISRLEPTCVCIADDVDIAQVAAGGSLCHYVSY